MIEIYPRLSCSVALFGNLVGRFHGFGLDVPPGLINQSIDKCHQGGKGDPPRTFAGFPLRNSNYHTFDSSRREREYDSLWISLVSLEETVSQSENWGRLRTETRVVA